MDNQPSWTQSQYRRENQERVEWCLVPLSVGGELRLEHQIHLHVLANVYILVCTLKLA